MTSKASPSLRPPKDARPIASSSSEKERISSGSIGTTGSRSSLRPSWSFLRIANDGIIPPALSQFTARRRPIDAGAACGEEIAGGACVRDAGGGFGARGRRGRLTTDQLAVFETAARYQMYHALALLLVSGTMTRGGGRWLELSGWMFVVGTLLFSGSLYALVLTGVRSLGAVTPLGGLAFLAGWAFLA